MSLVSVVKRRLDPSVRLADDITRMERAFFCGKRLRCLLLRWSIARRFGCWVSPGAYVGKGAEFPHPTGIVIGEGAVIGDECVIYQNVTIGRARRDEPGYPRLGDGCTVYAGAVIVGDIEIAPGTIVAANAVVTRGTNMENDVLAGVPARSKLASGGGFLDNLSGGPRGRLETPAVEGCDLAVPSRVAA